MKIPITKAVFDEKDLQIVQEPLKTGWVVQGQYVKAFEDKFVSFTGAKYAIACSSCTTALHISLAVLGIGPGDEVIVPAFTWIATANSAEYLGAKAIFCDIDIQTFNIDVKQIEEKITSKTKAIIPVHLFGLSAEMETIMSIARKHNLFVVEDAACGFASKYNDIHVGNFGDFGCFSFHPRKAITTGEGGMILTSDSKRAELCRSLRDHGASKSDLARHSNKAAFLLSEFNHLGYNYRMTDIQGAIGVTQMEKANWIQERRTNCAKRYDLLLKDVEWLKTPYTPENCIHGYQSYVCLFQPEQPIVSFHSLQTLKNVEKLNDKRNELMLKLEEIGISTRQGTHAVTTLGFYQKKYGIKNEDFPNAFISDRLTITLPVYAQMTEEEQNYVVDNLKKIYKQIM
jgi:dTDP-4-amino-4,6-dideoxygalactose transaminase